MTDPSSGYELSIVVTGQGNAAPVVDQTTQALDRLKQKNTENSDAFEISRRRSEAFAQQGLAQISNVVPGVTGALGDLARGSETLEAAFAAIGWGGLFAGAAMVGVSIGQLIGEYVVLGESLDRYNERQKKIIDDEKAYQELLQRRSQFLRDVTRATLDADAAVTASQERRAGLEARAIETERQAKLAQLALDQREAEDKLAKMIREEGTTDGALARQQQLVEEFAAKRRKILDDDYAAYIKATDDRYEHEQQADEAATAAIAERRQAQLQIAIDYANNEGRAIVGARLTAAQQIAEITADLAAKEQKILADLRAKTIDQVTADKLRGEAAATASAKVQAALQSEVKARRDAIAAAAAALDQALGPAPSPAELAANVATARETLGGAFDRVAAAAGVGQPVGATTPLLLGSADPRGFVEAQVEQVRALDAAWAEAEQAVAAYNATVAAQDAANNRPQLLQGLTALDQFQQTVNKYAEALAAAEKSGVPVNDILQEQDRITAVLQAQWQELNRQYANTPAVIQQLEQRFSDLSAPGGFAARVRDAIAGVGTAGSVVDASLTAFNAKLQTLPEAAGPASQALDLLTPRFNSVRDAANGATAAIQQFAFSASTAVAAASAARAGVAAASTPSAGPSNTGITVIDPRDIAGTVVDSSAASMEDV